MICSFLTSCIHLHMHKVQSVIFCFIYLYRYTVYVQYIYTVDSHCILVNAYLECTYIFMFVCLESMEVISSRKRKR